MKIVTLLAGAGVIAVALIVAATPYLVRAWRSTKWIATRGMYAHDRDETEGD